jgi:uncharacterized ParB-like nuclease family protein
MQLPHRCVENLTQIIDETYHKYGDQYFNELKRLYAAFRDRNNVNSLIEIYTLTTPPMSTILRSNAASLTDPNLPSPPYLKIF